MRSWTSPDIYRPISRNVLFYDGPSMLTGDRILAIATAQNGNRKVGHMLQIWILPAISPIAAVKSGADAAICGDCKLRGDRGVQRACYVEHWRSAENIWQARDKATRLTPEAFSQLASGLQLRIGAYGDPAAVPFAVWVPLLRTAAGFTAYSHQWKTADPVYRLFCMASVDSEAEKAEASAMGWRTFRVRHCTEPLLTDEVMCPASEEAGHAATCATCNLCRGLARPAKSIAIFAHGPRVKWFGSTIPTAEPVSEGART